MRERFGSKTLVSYDPEIALAICDRVASGETLTEICKEIGMPARKTFWRWCMMYKGVGEAFNTARELSAQDFEERALLIARKLEADKEKWTATQVRAFDVAMQQYRWSASRRDPGRYGTQAATSLVVPIQINTSLDLNNPAAVGSGTYSLSATITGEDALTPPQDPGTERKMKPRSEETTARVRKLFGAQSEPEETPDADE